MKPLETMNVMLLGAYHVYQHIVSVTMKWPTSGCYLSFLILGYEMFLFSRRNETMRPCLAPPTKSQKSYAVRTTWHEVKQSATKEPISKDAIQLPVRESKPMARN